MRNFHLSAITSSYMMKCAVLMASCILQREGTESDTEVKFAGENTGRIYWESQEH